MSTRCQIGFYRDKPDDLDRWNALLYKHCDGYPDSPEGIIALLSLVLLAYSTRYRIEDTEYTAGFVCADLTKKRSDGCGISKNFHGDIAYFYAVYPDAIDVYLCRGLDPDSWDFLQTVKFGDEWQEDSE